MLVQNQSCFHIHSSFDVVDVDVDVVVAAAAAAAAAAADSDVDMDWRKDAFCNV